ncbi:MAG: peptidoglycan recognition family protein [Planctomycetota bacterium]
MTQPTSNISNARSAPVALRTRIVWGSLVLSMGAVGVLLWGLQGGRAPRVDGLTLTPLVAAAGPSSVEAIFETRTPIDPDRWLSIVVHHSGSAAGSPATIADEHRSMNLNGLGYHFVIGNGRGAGDGAIHVGYRWLEQAAGAHAAGQDGDWYNRHAIGVCLVGDGNRRGFTDRQMRRLSQLVRALSEQLDIPEERIVLHSDIAPTNDPGRLFPRAMFRESLAALR